MSVDWPTVETVTNVGRRLPNSATIRKRVVTVLYLAVLIVGLTVLVTLDLVARLSIS